MASVKVDIINRALSGTGNNTILTETDTTTEAVVALSNYEGIVEDALSMYPWKFARKTQSLSLVGAATNSLFEYEWAMPADVLSLRTVRKTEDIDYEHDASSIWCNENQGVYAVYTWRVLEDKWPGYFKTLITQKLAALFQTALNEDTSKSEQADLTMRRHEAVAKNADSRTDRPRDVWKSPLVERHRA